MHNEHNPIAQIINKMQQHWQQRVKPGTALVRWLLKANEHRMYEGFCRLEASPHGGIDELFVFFYTPFISAETFSRDVLQNWLDEIKEQEKQTGQADVLIDKNILDYQSYENQLEGIDSNACDAILVNFMEDFRQLSNKKDIPLVLSILPKTMSSPAAFGQWINRFASQEIPQGIRLLVFDHTEGNYWAKVFEQYFNRAVTLHQDLHLDAAIKQIATGGDAGSPDVQFRRCMFEMGDAASKKQLTVLHQWGKRAIEAGTKSGQKTLLATACITYAGMLFTFKDFHSIQSLLDDGLRICKQSIANGDESAKSLLLQFYGYKAAAFQHQKETRLAMEWFMRQGREAKTFGLYAQSIAAYYKAFLMAQYKNRYNDQALVLKEALSNTPFLEVDEIQSSEFPYIVYEYAQLERLRIADDSDDMLTQASVKIETVYGSDWKKTVQEMKMNYNKKEIQIREAAARVS